MKVMHLLQSTHFSGAENVVCQIISMIHDEKDIELFYCSRGGQIQEALQERKISFVPIGKLSVGEVKRVIKEQKPDIIHAHDMRASYIAAQSCGKIPVVSHIHNNSFDSRGFSVKAIAYLIASVKIKHIFWVSDSSFQGYAFHVLLKKKSEILYNIINIDELYKKMSLDNKKYDYDIVYLGRLTRPKNPVRLMHVFKGIIEKQSKVKIAVIGTGELESETYAEAKKLDILNNVTFLGFQNNPYKMLFDSKLMIMTSLWEGTPMCVLEAMSLGVPVVSTPTDGVKVVIENEKTGILSDNDEILISACCRILDNSELRDEMSKNAKKRALELMDIKSYKEKLLNVYAKLR